jgi:uncharacterized protein YoxC
MLAFLASSVGKYVMIAVLAIILLGGAFLYVKYTQSVITSLSQQVTGLQLQTKDLQAANTALQQDIQRVQQAENATNQALQSIRLQSAQMARAIQSRTFNTSDPKALEIQVNKDTAATLKGLEDASRP